MFATALACYWTFVGSLVNSPYILTLALIATVGFFLAMHFKPDLRKDAPLNHTYLMAGAISMLVLVGSFVGMYAKPFVLAKIMAIALVMGGLYGGALFAKTSTNREYLIRKLLTGVFAAFLICILMMVMFMSSDKKNESSTGLFVFTFFIFMLAAVYMGYTVVFIILPGMVEDPKDYILGVTRIFTQIFIIIWAILVILFNMIKNCLCGPSSHEELA